MTRQQTPSLSEIDQALESLRKIEEMQATYLDADIIKRVLIQLKKSEQNS